MDKREPGKTIFPEKQMTHWYNPGTFTTMVVQSLESGDPLQSKVLFLKTRLLILGVLPSWKQCAFFGALLSGVSSASSMHLLDPFLLFIICAFGIFSLLKIRTVLKFPRMLNTAFILGMSFKQRQALCTQYALETSFLLTCFSFFTGFFLIGIRGILTFFGHPFSDTLSVGLLIVFVSFVTIGIVLQYPRLCRAQKTDYSPSGAMTTRCFSLFNLDRFFEKSATLLSLPLRNVSRLLLRRQLLYLVRGDRISGVIIPGVLMLLYLFVIPLLAVSSLSLSTVLLMAAPVFIFSQYTTIFGEARQKLTSCIYSGVLLKDLFRANIFLCFEISFPFFFLFTLFVSKHLIDHPKQMVFWLLGFVFIMVATSMAFSYRWLFYPGNHRAISFLISTIGASTIAGASIVFGQGELFYFPVLTIIPGLWLITQELRQ